MKKVLITDPSKASVVMTSEVFKDYFPGVQILVAHTHDESLNVQKDHKDIDIHVIDFHLHEQDAIELALKSKKQRKTPIIMTAFHSDHVVAEIDNKLAEYPDCLNWVKKPVSPDLLVAIAERYVKNKIRQERRIDCSIPAFVKVVRQQHPKAPKETLKLFGVLENVSIGGVKFRLHPRELSLLSQLSFTEKDLNPNLFQEVEIFIPDDLKITEIQVMNLLKQQEDRRIREAVKKEDSPVVKAATSTKKTTVVSKPNVAASKPKKTVAKSKQKAVAKSKQKAVASKSKVTSSKSTVSKSKVAAAKVKSILEEKKGALKKETMMKEEVRKKTTVKALEKPPKVTVAFETVMKDLGFNPYLGKLVWGKIQNSHVHFGFAFECPKKGHYLYEALIKLTAKPKASFFKIAGGS